MGGDVMKSEDDPVTPDEWLLRLVWHDKIKSRSPTIISPSSFEPRSDEINGISVFRSACLCDPAIILRVIAEGKRRHYGIVELPVAFLLGRGLSVVCSRIDLVPGHAEIPEININAYRADKPRLKALLARLAEEATRRPPLRLPLA